MSMTRDLIAALDRLIEADEYRTKQRITAAVERRLARDLAAAFQAQGAEVIRRLATIRGQFGSELVEAPRRTDWDRLIQAALAATRRRFIRILGRGAREAMRLGATRLISTLGLQASFTLRSPRAVERIADVGARRVAGIEAATRDDLRRILTRAVDNGWSYTRTTREIRGLYREFSTKRALRITVTETADAYEHGRASMIREMEGRGQAFEKSWLTAGDDRVDTPCSDNEAQSWIPATESFSSGVDTPPAHPSCRCVTLYRPIPTSAGDVI